MDTLAIRLLPGQDVRRALEAAVAGAGCSAAFVVSGIGSLSTAEVRFAGREHAETRRGDLEILTLAGTIAPGASHLHASLSDAEGTEFGGHLGHGCVVRTTCEILVALLEDWVFTRELDPHTGFAELVARRKLQS